MAVVHLAIAQFRPRKGDVDGNIRRMGEILAQAAALDPAPHVVQFAETVPSGYFVEGAVREIFHLRPAGIIESLQLLRPIYSKTAAYGHFGRAEPEFTWEKLDQVAALKKLLG